MTSHGPIRDARQPEPPRNQPHGRLLRALVTLGGGQGLATIDAASHSPWASATFQGMRHLILLRLSGVAAETRAATLNNMLAETDFTLPGHIVADLAVDRCARAEDGRDWLLSLSALTIESW